MNFRNEISNAGKFTGITYGKMKVGPGSTLECPNFFVKG